MSASEKCVRSCIEFSRESTRRSAIETEESEVMSLETLRLTGDLPANGRSRWFSRRRGRLGKDGSREARSDHSMENDWVEGLAQKRACAVRLGPQHDLEPFFFVSGFCNRC